MLLDTTTTDTTTTTGSCCKGSKSVSVVSICGRRRLTTTGRRVNVQYILDLLAFAVETGRLTEACADAVRHIIQNNPSSADDCYSGGSSLTANERPVVVARGVVNNSSSGSSSSTSGLPHVDEETVLREVRFRKTYHGLQRTTPCGFNPYDKTTTNLIKTPHGGVGGSFYNQSAFEITSSAPAGSPEIFGDFDTLEDLLAKLELCRGTPVESIKQAVRVKRELVGHILRRGGALTRPNVYKRLARALDQRVPPDQRLLSTPAATSTRAAIAQVRKQSSKAAAAAVILENQSLPSCWHRKSSAAGSQLFRTPTKLSDFMIQNDQS